MVPTSTSTIYNVFENNHMLWRGGWIHHHSHFHTCWPRNTGVCQIPGSQLGYKWCHGALVEAQDQLGIVPSSTSNIYKVFEIVHVLWMVRWIHHHATSTILFGPDFWELAEYISNSSDTISWLGYRWCHGALTEVRPKTALNGSFDMLLKCPHMVPCIIFMPFSYHSILFQKMRMSSIRGRTYC